MLSVYEPTSNLSQAGNRSADGRWCSSASCQFLSQERSERETASFEFPSWEGSGVGSQRRSSSRAHKPQTE